MFHTTLGALPLLVLAVSRLANARCECGYSLNSTSDPNYAVFTEVLENDFLHTLTASINLTYYGWQPQVYNVSSDAARGPFGKNFELNNVVTNPLKKSGAWSGQAEHGGDAGLELWVRGGHRNGLVSGAEFTSVRNDSRLGSFRVGMKLSNSSGTCGAFFFYHNNSQEIDIEFLSHQFNKSQGAVNLVLQSSQSVTKGYDASGTSGYTIQRLPFRPDQKFHEYRFDWTKDRVAFYVDGQFLYDMTDNIPSEGGGMFFNHWSNGDQRWSAGPPEKDTVMTISYIKSYFNSTNTERSQVAYKKRCPSYDESKVCVIPTQHGAPDASNGKNAPRTYFFSLDKNDMTPGQITYHSAADTFGASFHLSAVPILVTFLSWTLMW